MTADKPIGQIKHLSDPQRRMLLGASKGDAYRYVYGLAAHGGAMQTAASLLRAGYLVRDAAGDLRITDAGRAVIGLS